MASLGKINLVEDCPDHPFSTGCILFGVPKPSKSMNRAPDNKSAEDEKDLPSKEVEKLPPGKC